MKHNWDLKSFTDVAATITPTSKIEKSKYMNSGLYPIISQEDSLISGYCNNPDDLTLHHTPVVIFGDHTRVLKYVDFEFAVGADGVKIIQPKEKLNAKFLYHYLHWLNVPSLGYARHFKLIKEAQYPVPPMNVQKQIVAELDKTNEIISDCKDAIRNLDILAQSLFYDYFSDTIINHNKHKISPLNNICTVTSSNRIFADEYCENGIPFYRGKEVSELSRGENISTELYISKERYELLKASNNIPQMNDILITAVGTIGNIWIVNSTKPFYFKDGNIIWLKDIDYTSINSVYFKFFLNKLIQDEKEKMANGSAYKALTIQKLKKTNVILPPLALQQKFASKIVQIEAQKKDLEEIIANMQTLLDSRMDYWFG